MDVIMEEILWKKIIYIKREFKMKKIKIFINNIIISIDDVSPQKLSEKNCITV